MSFDSKYLSAFTPSDRGVSWHSYPPFINFTQVGDKVKVIVRSTDQLNEDKGYYETKSYATMEICTEEFKKLLETALSNLEL